MIAIAGFLLVALAVLAAVSGVLSNVGSTHPLGTDFGIAGLHLSGLSVGQLFLYGVVVGAVAMLGLSMLLGTFSRRLASRGARRDLKGARRETQGLLLDRERLTQQLADQRPRNGDEAAYDDNAHDDNAHRGSGHDDSTSSVITRDDIHRVPGDGSADAADPADRRARNQPVDGPDLDRRAGPAGLLKRVTHRSGGRP